MCEVKSNISVRQSGDIYLKNNPVKYHNNNNNNNNNNNAQTISNVP